MGDMTGYMTRDTKGNLRGNMRRDTRKILAGDRTTWRWLPDGSPLCIHSETPHLLLGPALCRSSRRCIESICRSLETKKILSIDYITPKNYLLFESIPLFSKKSFVLVGTEGSFLGSLSMKVFSQCERVALCFSK